jgi:hypothetical protein
VLPGGELNFIEVFGAGGRGERGEKKTNFENSMNRGKGWRLIACLSEGLGKTWGFIRRRKRTGRRHLQWLRYTNSSVTSAEKFISRILQ